MKCLWQQIPNTIVSEIYCNSKFDGIVLDTEHSAWNNETLFQHIQLITLKKKCFVRLTEINKTLIRMCLDANVTGLIFSTIETKAQCIEINKLCDYNYKRGVGLVRENLWGELEIKKRYPILIAQIETYVGICNCNIINKYFDYCMIGPYDLSRSLGDIGNFKTNDFKDMINIFESNIKIKKRGYHIVKDIKRQYNKIKNYGFIAMSMDTILLNEGLRKLELI